MIIIRKNKLFILMIIQIFIFLLFITNTYAVDIIVSSESADNLVNQYTTYEDNGDKESSKFLINDLNSHLYLLTKKIGVGMLTYNDSFDLRDYYDISVKDQGLTESCWAFSLLSSAEINMQMQTGEIIDLSERHMNYATSNSFYDGTNEMAFNRTASEGSSFIIGLAYMTNGQGMVLEDEMKFSNDTSDISLSEIDIEPSYYVKEYETLPTIYKLKSGNETVYVDEYGESYTDEEVDEIRQIIKNHIVEYGGVSAYTAGSAYEFYSNKSDIFNSSSYYCDDMSYDIDHAVTIIGWDDNYSKDNFTGAAKPEKDGAYIVLNSYSENSFDDGFLYVSYEDVWIESTLYGITEISPIDYENLYQHDEFGGNVPITLQSSNGESYQEQYYASIYSRDENDFEELTDIAITTNQYAEFEVYVNPNGSELTSHNLQLVATTDILSPGYNTISFDGIKLTGNEFAVVVKQKVVDQSCYIMIEAKIDNTMYSTASAEIGNSRVSIDGRTWYDLADLGSVVYDQYVVDLSQADVCIKAFTKEDEEAKNVNISSEIYKISSDNYITKIYDETTINEFLEGIDFNNENYEILDKNKNLVTDYTALVTTDMTIKVGDKEYILVVRADLDRDGKITLTDISKQILHYVNYEGYILSGAPAKAADIDLDGEFTLTDVSQLKLIYVNRKQE